DDVVAAGLAEAKGLGDREWAVGELRRWGDELQIDAVARELMQRHHRLQRCNASTYDHDLDRSLRHHFDGGAASGIEHRGKLRFLSGFSRSGYARAVERFRAVICGGGIAAVGGLLRLRRRGGDSIDVTLLAPNEELRYRPVAVQEPFSRPSAKRYPVREVARKANAEWVQAALEWVDPDGQVAHTVGGGSLEYDALLLAVGARGEVPYEHVTVFDDANADDTFRGVVQDIEDGYTHSIALLLPDGPAWPLPIYELALMTAQRADSMWIDELGVDLVTA